MLETATLKQAKCNVHFDNSVMSPSTDNDENWTLGKMYKVVCIEDKKCSIEEQVLS